MIRKNPFYSEKGITLVEIVVAMVLAVLVITVLAQMSGITDKMFNQGEEKSHNQMHMRIAADEITKNLRYAKNLEMIKDTDIPTEPYTGLDTSYDYIFFKDETSTTDSSLIILEHEGSLWVPKKHLEKRVDTDVTKSYFSFVYAGPPATPGPPDKNSVKFEITDKSVKHLADTDKYTLTTTINLQNVGSYPPKDPPELGRTNYKGIKYKR